MASHIKNSLNLAHGSMGHLYLCAMRKSYVITYVILLALVAHTNYSCLEIRQIVFELLVWEVFCSFLVLFLQDVSPVTGLCFLPSSPFQGHSFKETWWILKPEGQKQDSFINILKIQSIIYEVCEVF